MDKLRIWVIGACEICYLGMRQALSTVDEVLEVSRLSADAASGLPAGLTSCDVCILSSCQLHGELITLCTRVHAEAPETPILIWSHGNHLDAGDMFRAGASGYVSSCSAAELSRALEAIRQGYQYCDMVNSQPDCDDDGGLDVPRLTPRQKQIQTLAVLGLSDKEIAQKLCISRHTVRSHLRAVFNVSGVRRRSELMLLHTPWHPESVIPLSC